MGVKSGVNMPPRALGMKHSHTLVPVVRTVDSSTNTMARNTGRRLKKPIQSLESLDSTLTYISEVLL